MALDSQVLVNELIKAGLIDEKAGANLIEQADSRETSLEQLLFEKETITEDKLVPIIASIYGREIADLNGLIIADELLKIVPYTLASNQLIIPFGEDENELKIASAYPDNYEIKNFLEKKTGKYVRYYYATPSAIKIALKAYNKDVNEKFHKLLEGALGDPNNMESLKDSAKILDTIILFAFQNNASDIHMEPHKGGFIIRYRMDGILHTITELPLQLMDLLTTRIKVLSNMRTDDHKSAQDGRFKIEIEKNEITMRVSIVPTYDGEKTVLRLLTTGNQTINLESMGYNKTVLNVIKNNMHKTSGMLLVTGPTGSGKTTSLYSVLRILHSPQINISTIEDPIEYRLEGVNQIQVNPKTNLTFAAGLRALLRQDPDVILVGEIRDEETAKIGVNAALTGHVVLATLHTNDAATTLPRLMEMGVEPFLIGATVKMVIAQRLIRTICEKCKKEYEITYEQLKQLEQKLNFDKDLKGIMQSMGIQGETVRLFKGEGCSTCSGTGYKGRKAVAEAIEVTDTIRKLILSGSTAKEIEEQAIKEGMISMFIDGLYKAFAGDTTIEEVLRVLRA